MILAHKIALDVTCAQRNYLHRATGTSRFVYNWALAEWKRQYAEGARPKATQLKREFNQIKYTQFPWMKEIHRDAHSQPFANLQSAFTSFFKKKAKYPKFKKRGRRDSFYVANDKLRVDGRRVRLPKIGWIKTREQLRFKGKVMGAVVSREADRWFVSIQVKLDDPKRQRVGDGIVGVDLGVKTTATLSTGEKVEGPKAFRSAQKRLRRAQRSHSRKVKGSKNRMKSTMRLARLHRRIKNVRNDFLHKLTTRLCRENQAVAIEDLNVRGMVKNHCLARAVSDEAFGEFRRQVTYKTVLYDSRLVVADRWFPSTKKCSRCGAINDMPLSQRTYRCVCGSVMDRDDNAAKNLEQLCTAGLAGNNACGEDGSGHESRARGETILVEAGTKPRVDSRLLTI